MHEDLAVLVENNSRELCDRAGTKFKHRDFLGRKRRQQGLTADEKGAYTISCFLVQT
jgi:hypothetical protein